MLFLDVCKIFYNKLWLLVKNLGWNLLQQFYFFLMRQKT